jgi:hypothetical protein
LELLFNKYLNEVETSAAVTMHNEHRQVGVRLLQAVRAQVVV